MHYTKAVFTQNFTAEITYNDNKQQSTYPFQELDELQFSDCQIFQERGICTFNLMIGKREALAYIPSWVLTWHVETRHLTHYFDWIKDLDWSTIKRR